MNDFLAQASAFARRICRDAIWAGDACNWMGPFADSFNAWDLRHRSFGPDLYSGTSGVALFLALLARTSGERLMRKTAEGAARHAHKHAWEFPPAQSMGVYSGTVGVAWALLRVGELLNSPEWREKGAALLDTVCASDAAGAPDILSGYAGAVPVLLEMARVCGRPAWTAAAMRLGDCLERAAERSSEGWSWRTIDLPGREKPRNLTGFSHGAAGIAWAFAELSAATGEQRFRAAADEGFRYERSHFSAEHENWPDFRDYLRPPGAAAGPAFATAWCHGAPGIALSRLRAWRLTGDALVRDEAEAAVRTTQRAVAAPEAARAGFSLCHGCAGNADVLLEAEHDWQNPDLRASAEAVAHYGMEQFEARRLPWPCGIPGAGETCNLMLGTAGIGYFYLRLADPLVPTVLRIGPQRGNGFDPLGQPLAT